MAADVALPEDVADLAVEVVVDLVEEVGVDLAGEAEVDLVEDGVGEQEDPVTLHLQPAGRRRSTKIFFMYFLNFSLYFVALHSVHQK